MTLKQQKVLVDKAFYKIKFLGQIHKARWVRYTPDKYSNPQGCVGTFRIPGKAIYPKSWDGFDGLV
jgi:hypothetical protein